MAPGDAFDPLDGGVQAQVLFLFESPGEGALASRFASRDNRDPSAAMFAALNKEAGLDRGLAASKRPGRCRGQLWSVLITLQSWSSRAQWPGVGART